MCCEYVSIRRSKQAHQKTMLAYSCAIFSLSLSLFQVAHYSNVIMGTMASQITSLTNVYSVVSSGADQRKHQSPASLAFVRGNHRSPVNFPHKGPVTQKLFPFDDVIMRSYIRRKYDIIVFESCLMFYAMALCSRTLCRKIDKETQDKCGGSARRIFGLRCFDEISILKSLNHGSRVDTTCLEESI